MIRLDSTIRDPDTAQFERELANRVVGQDRAIRALSRVYQMWMAGLAAPGRPISNLLLLGPTGSGKTRLVEAVAEILFGTVNAIVKVDCAEFQHSHEIAKLIGSPPGYLGHRETTPLITQEKLDASHTATHKFSLVLFDEIEKASDALWQLLLGILDKAALTLGTNSKVDLSKCIIFMTSNLGSADINKLMTGSMGFNSGPALNDQDLDQKIYRIAKKAATHRFSPEFLNRIDKLLAFRSLKDEHLKQILSIELARVQERIMASSSILFVFNCLQPALDFLLREGIDMKFGARHLKRAIERHLVTPLAGLISSGQISDGDLVIVGEENDKLTFEKEDRGALVQTIQSLVDIAIQQSDGQP